MTTQIAIRLPDELVTFLDRSVRDGVAPSRAALVRRALERQMRLQAALNDAAILHEQGTEDDLDDLVTWTATQMTTEQ